MTVARLLLILAAVQVGWSTTASGGLILTVDDLKLPAGGTGFLDVTIRSDGSESLSLFSFAVEIQPLGVALGQLAFTDPQRDLQLCDADYIFFGDSTKQIAGFRSAASQGHIAEFESTPGTVTIVGAMAVPEPASIGMLCIGALGLAATPVATRQYRCQQ